MQKYLTAVSAEWSVATDERSYNFSNRAAVDCICGLPCLLPWKAAVTAFNFIHLQGISWIIFYRKFCNFSAFSYNLSLTCVVDGAFLCLSAICKKFDFIFFSFCLCTIDIVGPLELFLIDFYLYGFFCVIFFLFSLEYSIRILVVYHSNGVF